MPLITAVPRPPIRWWAEWGFPYTLGVGTALPGGTVPGTDFMTTPAFKAGATSNAAGSVGGTGVTTNYVNFNGRLHARGRSTAAVWGQSFYFPWWTFRADNVAQLAAGYQEDDVNRLAWFRIGNTQSAVDATWDQNTGFYFLPYVGSTFVGANLSPSAGSFPGGVGIVADGAGGWMYRSWNAAAAAIDTVAIAPAVIGTLTNSRIFDFIFRASTPTSQGWLTVKVNGTEIVSEQPYDGLKLIAPNTLSAQASTLALVVGSQNPGSGTSLYWWVHGHWGPWLLDGTEILG